MQFDDFDVDALLDAQSSDDDGNELPELERSLDDILNDDEFGDVLGLSLSVKSPTEGLKTDSDLAADDEREISRLDGELLGRDLESHRNGEISQEAEGGKLVPSVSSDQKERCIGDANFVLDTCSEKLEKKFPTQPAFLQDFPGSVGTGTVSQGRCEIQMHAEEDLADAKRVVTGLRSLSGWESNGRLPAPVSFDTFSAAAVRSSSKGRHGVAFAAAAAASRQMGSSDSAASKFAKTFSVRPKSLVPGKSADSKLELQTDYGNQVSNENSPEYGNKSVHLELSHDELDDSRFKLQNAFDTTEEEMVKKEVNDEVYSAVIEECLDKLENHSSTIEILEQQRPSSSSSSTSDTGRRRDGADDESEVQLSVPDSSSSKDASETDDEENDEIGASKLANPQNQVEVICSSLSGHDALVGTEEQESRDVHSLNSWTKDIQEHVITSTHDGLAQSSKSPTFGSLTDSDEEEESSRELVEQSNNVVVESQKSVSVVEEEPSRTALQLAEELEKRAASSGLHWEEGAVAQPMRLEGIQRDAPAIGLLQLDSGGALNYALKSAGLRRDHGTPQAVAVHSNFIAIGMSKGPVLIIPSKYSATKSADETDAKPYILIPTASEKHQMAVSSMSFNQQGDLLLVGYSNGHIILWDVPKGSVGKHIEKDNGAPIVHAVFVGQDVAASRTIRAITADSRGLTLLHSFMQIPFVRRFSHNSSVLLDGQRTGLVLSIAPLLPDEGIHISGGTNAPPSGMSSSPLNLGTVMSVVGAGVNSDVGRKFLYDGASANEEGGGLVVLATNQTALVVRLLPSLGVCARFSRPEGIRDGAIPYTAWRRAKGVGNGIGSTSASVTGSPGEPLQNTPPKGSEGRPTENGHSREDGAVEAGTVRGNGDGSENLPLLVMAWDKKVIVLQLLKTELKIVGQWELDSPAIGVAWLEQEMVVVATGKDELCLFTNEGLEIERALLTNEHGGLGALTYHTHFLNIFGNPEKAYHNSLAVRGAALYLLGPSQLWRARLLPWRDRIKALQNAGDSLGAFHIAMEIYDGRSQGVTGLPRGLDLMREAIMPTLLSLLSSYIDEAFAYLSLAFGSSPPSIADCDSATISNAEAGTPAVSAAGSGGAKDSVEDIAVEVKEQYARVGGVAIEFCVHIHKTEVLFENVFSKFDAVGQREVEEIAFCGSTYKIHAPGTFLELLEPYILKDMLGGLAPEVMQALVEHYSSRGWLDRVEQCVLHMDIASLDFNQVVRVCRDHGLYSALIYLFTKGLDDFKSPLEELLAVAQHSNDPQQARGYGLKLLVYVKYCFSGLAFPPGNGTLSAARLPQLRTELLEYLLDVMDGKKELAPERMGQKYSRLLYLLALDTQATLQVLGAAFPEDGPLGVGKRDCVYPLTRTKSEENALNNLVELPNEESIVEGLRLAQMTVDAVIHVLQTVESARSISKSEEELSNIEDATDERWPSRKDIGDMFEFVAYFAAGKYAVVPAVVLSQILVYLTSPVSEKVEKMEEEKKLRILRQREDLMLAVLKAAPKSDWDAERTLDLAQKTGYWQVTALLHAERGDFAAALESYLKDVTRPQDPFTFISHKLSSDDGLQGSDFIAFRESVLSHIPELIRLSPVSTLVVVLKHFSSENQHILKALAPHPRLLFNYMKAIMNIRSGGFGYSEKELQEKISSRQARHGESSDSQPPSWSGQRKEGSGNHSGSESQSYLADLLERSGIEFSDEMAENFVELLCRFEPKRVLPFLESYENYRLEHCLKLCQEYGITDAATFLLERVGDVASALSLVLADVQILLQEMDRALAQFFSLPSSSKEVRKLTNDEVKDKPEVEAVHSVLSAGIALCQRNTFRLEPRESEILWFRLLDRFVEPLRDINLHSRNAKTRAQNYLKGKSKRLLPNDVASSNNSISWKVTGNDLAVQTIRSLLVHCIGEIVNGMMGYVPISVTMSKILEEHGAHEFGDFKATILDMLSAYGYERAILGTANKLIEDDTFQNIYALRRGCSHAFVPSVNTCAVCGLRLDEPVDPSRSKSSAGAVGSGASSTTQNSDKQKGKVDDDSSRSSSEQYRLRVRIFPCGHATHYDCVVDSGSSKRNTSGLAVCPNCSYRGKPVDFASKINDTTLLRDTVIEVGARRAGDHDSSGLSQLGRMHKTTSRIFGRSRLEILKQLERGMDLRELGPSVELSLAPPVLTPYKRPTPRPPASGGSVSARGLPKSALTTAVLSMQRKNKSRAR